MFDLYIVFCLLSTNSFLHSYLTNNLQKADISCSDVTISKKENENNPASVLKKQEPVSLDLFGNGTYPLTSALSSPLVKCICGNF